MADIRMKSVRVLFEACESGDINETKRLIESARYDIVSLRTIDTRSVIDIAIDGKHYEIIKMLLPLGFDPEETLTRAAKTDDCEMVKMVLDSIPNITSKLLVDVINSICQYKRENYSAVNQLLSFAADQSITLQLAFAFMYVCRRGYINIARAIHAVNARSFYKVVLENNYDDPLRYPRNAADLVDLCKDTCDDIDVNDRSLLEKASRSGCLWMVQRMLAEGEHNRTHVIEAIEAATKFGQAGMIKLIVETKPVTYKVLNTCLGLACESPWAVETVPVLLRAVPKGTQPRLNFLFAAEAGCVWIVKRLLAKPKDLELINKALHRSSDPGMVRLLLDAKADVADTKGVSVLNRSCRKRQPESVQMLLDAGAQVGEHAADLLLASMKQLPEMGSFYSADDHAAVLRLVLSEGGPIDTPRTCARLLEVLRKGKPISAPVAQALVERLPGILSYGNAMLLAQAVQADNAPVVQVLLDAGANPNLGVIREAPVITHYILFCLVSPYPVASAKHDVFRALLAAGASVSACEGSGYKTVAMDLVRMRFSHLFSKRLIADGIVSAYLREVCESILARPALAAPPESI